MNREVLSKLRKEFFLYSGLLLILWALPLMGGARYEAALVAGIVNSLFIPVSTVLYLQRLSRLRGATLSLKRSLQIGAMRGLQFSLILLAIAGLHHLIWGTCELFKGFTLLALGPCAGAFASVTWAVLIQKVSESFRPPLMRWAWLVALLTGPILSFGLQLKSFYQSPMVYFYDHFTGYFAGPVYDSIDYRLDTLLWFRAETILLILGIYLFSCTIVTSNKRPRALLLLGLSLTIIACFSLLNNAHSLGYRRDASLSEALPMSLKNSDCTVRFNQGVSRQRAHLLLEECSAHRAAISSYLGLDKPTIPTVLLFSDAAQKQRLIGAGRTQVAKPWRSEVYITNEAFPHSILGHELAHALSGSIGQGPLKVAGHLGGLIPDPGRIEGLAVASSPPYDAVGTTSDWAAELLARKKLPPISDLFQLGFFTLSPRSSYVAAGSFVNYIVESYGSQALRQWYGGKDLEAVTKQTISQLEQQWHIALRLRPRSNELKRSAELRFQQRAVFQRTCPHLRDQLVKKAQQAAGSGSESYREPFEQALNWGARGFSLRGLPSLCKIAQKDYGSADMALAQLLAQKELTAQERSQAAQRRGDLNWLEGRLEAAQGHFKLALSESTHPDIKRNLKLRLWALSQTSKSAEALKDYLLAHLRAESSLASLTALAADENIQAALKHYLLGKALFAEASYALSAVEMRLALETELPLASVRHEARKILALASWAQSLLQSEPDKIVSEKRQASLNFVHYLQENLSPGELARAHLWASLQAQSHNLDQAKE